MKLKKIFLYLSDLFWYKLFRKNLELEYQKRKDIVLKTMLLFFKDNEPHVIDGKWSWYNYNTINVLFLEIPLAVQIQRPEIGQWNSVKVYCKSKEEWETLNRTNNELINLCNSINLSLITIDWNDPIDSHNLRLKLDAVIPPDEIVEELRTALRKRKPRSTS